MSFVMLEFECPEHGRFESLEARASAPDSMPCPDCAAPAPWVISAPLTRVKLGEVTRGKSDPHPPNVLDTRPLADGMPAHEWHAQQDKKTRDILLKRSRGMRA